MWTAGGLSYFYLGGLIVANMIYVSRGRALKSALYAVNHACNFASFAVMCIAVVPVLGTLFVAYGGATPRFRRAVRAISYRTFRYLNWQTRATRFIDMRFHDLSDGRVSDILVCNHVCMFDVVAILGEFRDCVTLVGAKYLANPLLRPMIAACGYIPVASDDRRSTVEAMLDAHKVVDAGGRIVVFPEATRSRDGGIGPLKKGVFRLAAATGKDLTPVFFTIDRAFLNSHVPKFTFDARCVRLDAYIMPPIRCSSFQGDVAPQLQAEFLRRYDEFVRSERALDFNRAPAVPSIAAAGAI
jgi:1-acyl-sn-glycerol-3-phosphate acyltransferase